MDEENVEVATNVDPDAAARDAAAAAFEAAAADAPSVEEPAPAEEAEADAPAPAAAETTDETPLALMRKEMAKRDDEQRYREKLRASVLEELKGETEAYRQRLTQETEQRLKAEMLERIRSRPVEWIKENQIDGTQFISELADRATPHGKLYDEFAQFKAAVAKDLETTKKRAETAEQQLQRLAEERQEAQKQQAYQRLVSQVEADPEAKGLISAYFGTQEHVIQRSQEIADEYIASTGNRSCPYDFVVNQLKTEAKSGVPAELQKLQARIDELSKLQMAAGDGKPTETNGQKGPRTLSAKGASERRATPKPRSEMSDAEVDEASVAAAMAVMPPRKASRSA